MKRIIGNTLNAHDHNWYDGDVHYQAERHSRYKMNLYNTCYHDYYLNHVKDRLADSNVITSFSYTLGGVRIGNYPSGEHPFDTSLKKYHEAILNHDESFKNLWDHYHEENFYYINHHQSHAAYALISSQYEESDVLVTDGGGIGYNAIFFDRTGKVYNLSDEMPLGWLWNVCSISAKLSARDSGKLMGAAGYGKPNSKLYDILELLIGQFQLFGKEYAIAENFISQVSGITIYDLAATIQQFTLDKIKECVIPLKTSDNLCVAGGVAYNGYMNELFTKYYKNVYVPPAPGDEGQSIGNYIHAEYVLNKKKHLPRIYNGLDYATLDEELLQGLTYEKKDISIIQKEVAKSISEGAIVGWFQGRSESGNRALGNRSIVADPRNPDIKNIINHTIKFREDFRPFAPSVLEEHYREWFDTNQSSPHMSRIMPVIEEKKAIVPGITHVDGTARIQTVTVDQNDRWYGLINEFYKITGVPMLVNTSFNCREPIVETPLNAINTFKKTNLDILVINDYIITK